MIQEAVPGEVKELLESQQLNGVPVLLSTTSDLSLTGRSARALDRRHARQPGRGRRRRRSRGWSTMCRSPGWRSSAPRARSARGSSRPTSRKRGSTSRGTRTRWLRRFHLLADKLEDLRTTGEVIVHPEEQRRQDPLPEVRHAACRPPASRARGACRGRRSSARLWQLMRPQWPTALAMCGLDARGRGHGARAAQAPAISGRRDPGPGRSHARMHRLAAGLALARRAGAGHARECCWGS